MQAEASAERFQVLGALCQIGEDLHLHGAQQGFRGPEGKTNLQDVIGWGRGNWMHARQLLAMWLQT